MQILLVSLYGAKEVEEKKKKKKGVSSLVVDRG
jgi:hypothetical protein